MVTSPAGEPYRPLIGAALLAALLVVGCSIALATFLLGSTAGIQAGIALTAWTAMSAHHVTRPPHPRLGPAILVTATRPALVPVIGGHYTCARVPAGFWVQQLFDLGRNHFDRLGHLAQGFVPAILVRELLRKHVPALRGGWLFLLVTCACLAFSAFYEMIEWWAALAGGDAAESFLGTQGDVWDTQWDMFLALIGALLSLALLSRFHDRQLERQGVKERSADA